MRCIAEVLYTVWPFMLQSRQKKKEDGRQASVSSEYPFPVESFNCSF